MQVLPPHCHCLSKLPNFSNEWLFFLTINLIFFNVNCLEFTVWLTSIDCTFSTFSMLCDLWWLILVIAQLDQENCSVSMPVWPNMVLIQHPIVDEVTDLYGLMYNTSNEVEFLKLSVIIGILVSERHQQALEWLKSPILEWQSLLQLVQM